MENKFPNRKTRRILERLEKLEKFEKNTGSGWGFGDPKNIPAVGDKTSVNPFYLPKETGWNIINKTFPNNYYLEWDLSKWRSACDQAMKMGYPIQLAALYSWTFESSAFVQSLFRELEVAISKIPVWLVDINGDKDEIWTKEICDKKWFKDICREIVFTNFWGFTGLNFDPINNKVYKYPLQDIDPINQFLRRTTFDIFEGLNFSEYNNLLYIQHNTSYESFLGWMQPISRSFIQMNINKNNWVMAGKRNAYPIMTAGYPQADEGLSTDEFGVSTNINSYRTQAENIIQNADPSAGIAYPYTKDERGNIIKSIDVDYINNKSSSNAYKIFEDFNEKEKDEIREMILLGTLSSSAGKNGARSLGEVHERKYEDVINHIVEVQVLSFLNDPTNFLWKVKSFYKNFPENMFFAINKAKQWDLKEVSQLSTILVQNGKRIKTEFFIEIGIDESMIEDIPQQVIKNSTKLKEPVRIEKQSIEIPEKKSILNVFSWFSKKK
jgi:hypothetical protein